MIQINETYFKNLINTNYINYYYGYSNLYNISGYNNLVERKYMSYNEVQNILLFSSKNINDPHFEVNMNFLKKVVLDKKVKLFFHYYIISIKKMMNISIIIIHY